ncbi:hypothetical protein ACQPZ2_37820 [Nocardia pseudovaccinii]|uniref:hypothetical protein n=1 Tax=Nocardia pseudovaccinii TaxID=189540 RepID=UPI003D8DE700
MRRDRLRTTESPDGRKIAKWRLNGTVAQIHQVQNRADSSPAYRWPEHKQVPNAERGLVLFDEASPPDLATAREMFPGHGDLWDAIRHERLLLIFRLAELPTAGEQ